MPFRVDIYTRYSCILHKIKIFPAMTKKMLKGQTINKQRKKFNTIKSTAKKKTVLRLHENNFQIFSCFCLINLINKKTLKRIWSEKS